MKDFLKVGLITKPQGIKGEVKVEPLTSDISRFKNIKEVFIDDKPVKVLSSKISGDTVFLSLFGVADRNNAELLRNKYISVKREDAIELEKNSFFIADIIGSTIFNDENEKVGKVVDVLSLKTDIFTVITESGKIMRFPFLKDLIEIVQKEAQFYALVDKIPVSGAGSLGIPYEDTDASDASWTAEVPENEISADTAWKFGKRELSPTDLTKLILISKKLLKMTYNGI